MSNELGTEFFEGNLYFNGIDGETGRYLLPPMPSEVLARLIQGKVEPAERAVLLGERPSAAMTEEQNRQEAEAAKASLDELEFKTKMVDFPVKEGVDPARLDQAGWAILFPAKMEAQRKEAIKEALKPLLDLRREQAGDELFRIYEGGDGYRPGERKDQFFKRQKPEIHEGPADPTQMPFYVLLVGNPEEIPYEFQFQLDVMRGVGRIDFGDDYAAYGRYAQSVSLAERGKTKLPRRASFFGVATPGDKATQLSAEWLIKPLYENLQQTEIAGEIKLKHAWQLDSFIGGQATKAQLGRLLGGDPAQTPSLLFTASHGMAFKPDHPQQLAYQGALLCQDWAGPGHGIKRDDYFAGEDLVSDAQVQGMMALFFACYGAGTPKWDHFAKQAFKARSEIAPNSFIGGLPRRLLSQGALAVLGHVERAWGYSFVSPGGNLDNQAFITVLRKLLNGDPVGLATDPSFNLRYAAKAANLSSVLEEEEWSPGSTSPYDLAYLWTSNNDARNYVVIGDPAARLPATSVAPAEAKRPEIEVSFRQPETVEVEAAAQPYAAESAAPGKPQAAPGVQVSLAAAGTQTYSVSGTVTLQPMAGAAAPAPSFTIPEVPTAPGATAYGFLGIGEGASDIREKLVDAVQRFVERMGQAVEKAVAEVTTLEVLTYTSDDMAKVEKNNMDGTASLRAITRIKADGDIEICVPSRDGQIDQALWGLHSDMVEQAQANRAEMMRTAVEVVSGLLKVV
jgi:hypothetical protein